jgi:uncharacterized membrane protein YhiD involved in acid resistance
VTGAELVHVLVAVALTYALGFERDLRGSPAGDRVFALLGVAAGIVGVGSATTRRRRGSRKLRLASRNPTRMITDGDPARV